MEEMIKPYRVFVVEENSIYRIERYNVIKKKWEILPGSYSNIMDAQIEVDKLNEEAGLIQL